MKKISKTEKVVKENTVHVISVLVVNLKWLVMVCKACLFTVFTAVSSEMIEYGALRTRRNSTLVVFFLSPLL